MIYSCFDAPTGLYRYFETAEAKAINADLPVPSLPRAVGRVGVPAILAGRPLPADARPAGTGWAARGILVRCDGGGALAGGDVASQIQRFVLGATVVAALAAGGIYLLVRRDQ